MSRDLPGVHEPDRMLNAVARVVDAVLKARGAGLMRVSVGTGGTLRMDVRAARGPSALVWVRRAPGGVPVERFGGVVAVAEGSTRPDDEDLPGAVARVLGTLDPATFPMLRFEPERPEPLVFDKGASEALFGPLLTPGLTRWRGWVCEAIT